MISTANLLDNTVRNPEELSRQVDLPILGVIPHSKINNAEPITLAQPSTSISEAYRALSNNVEHANPEKKMKRILITSPLSEEGKTIVVINLAIIMAQRGLHTILMDGDMHWPSTHRYLGLPNNTGLSDFFSITQVVTKLRTFKQQNSRTYTWLVPDRYFLTRLISLDQIVWPPSWIGSARRAIYS